MKKLLLLPFILTYCQCCAQIFDLKKSYTGYHYAHSPFKEDFINQFVVQFNAMWSADLDEGFSQYKGGELGKHFTTSGLRVIWGKNTKWTASTDYAFGSGKDKNEARFKNGITQHLTLISRCNQINLTFGIVKKEGKVWLEGIYSTNLGKVFIEYYTEYQDGTESFGSEYKLHGLYTGYIKTAELGFQASRRKKKNVFYTRVLFPVMIMGPAKNERNFVDVTSTQSDPRDFPSEYDAYVSNMEKYFSQSGALQSNSFKGISFGVGMFHMIGKNKE